MNISTQTRSGFSLIELVIAITLMAIFALVAVPSFLAIRAKGAKTATATTIKALENAIDSFQADTGIYPTTLSELVQKPTDEKISKRWEGPYLKKEVSDDAYKHELVYRVTKGSKHPYELYSWGPNGEGSPESEWINVWDI